MQVALNSFLVSLLENNDLTKFLKVFSKLLEKKESSYFLMSSTIDAIEKICIRKKKTKDYQKIIDFHQIIERIAKERKKYEKLIEKELKKKIQEAPLTEYYMARNHLMEEVRLCSSQGRIRDVTIPPFCFSTFTSQKIASYIEDLPVRSFVTTTSSFGISGSEYRPHAASVDSKTPTWAYSESKESEYLYTGKRSVKKFLPGKYNDRTGGGVLFVHSNGKMRYETTGCAKDYRSQAPARMYILVDPNPKVELHDDKTFSYLGSKNPAKVSKGFIDHKTGQA